MFSYFQRFFENRRIKKQGLTAEQWEAAVADWPVMQRYQGKQRDRLREMSFRFLARKEIASGSGFQFTHAMLLKLATMACVPVLNLGLDWYDHWYTVILYEGDFVPHHPEQSEDGVVHTSSSVLSGEAWEQGPVILSWAAICEAGATSHHGLASNVVIHEMAHKLDMLRDGANGAPPMHPDMRAGEWHTIFTDAWEQLNHDHQHHRALPIDDYALTSPAEFFAVCSETFFEAPAHLNATLPEIYRLLSQFYRQAPLQVLT
jgi:Mlc titration factor MtfA (ptsG expression regulator)